ncbi:hypothetical protein CY658_21765 [Variovorax sp. RO1]|uniref:hypothetical protein n=1 Tax=Variovorax sp. RO1 TaxID=2066034 RepID=UPI000C7185D4|nr:hypothetical protein [Variovorax sp. RO1]PLC03446.1 hypothetical protein CY658_21765 [Variovorax sp. RO1]
MTTPTNQPISLTKAASAILVPVIVALIIGGFTLIWKMDRLTETLTYKFETVANQVKGHDGKLEEIDRRIRVLELEVALNARGRR